MRIENLNDFTIKNNNKVSTKDTNGNTAFNDLLKNALDDVNQLHKDSESYTNC